MKDIVIVGAGGFGREVAWLIESINKESNRWNLLGFVDDTEILQGKKVNGYSVLGDLNWLVDKELNVVVAIGDPIGKKRIVEKLKSSKNCYPTLIDPSVKCSDFAKIGEGTIICAGSILTVNIEIGEHVIINLDCTVGHDASIENYATILPSVNISGFVALEECVSIGTGTQIIQNIRVGKNTVVGAGAVVVRDLPENCIAVGSPAKPIKFKE